MHNRLICHAILASIALLPCAALASPAEGCVGLSSAGREALKAAARTVNATTAANPTMDFDALPLGPLASAQGVPGGAISNQSMTAVIAEAKAKTTSGHVLSGSGTTDNNVSLIFFSYKMGMDLTVIPDPAGKPACIEFLGQNDFATIHTETVNPSDGERQISYTAPASGPNIQGITWTGGQLIIDNVVLRPSSR